MRVLQTALRAGSSVLWGSLGLLYSPVCAVCQSPLDHNFSIKRFVCESCICTVEPIKRPWCLRCGDPQERQDADLCERCAHESFTFQWARSIGWYDGTLARLIQQLKYEGERALVHELAPLLQFYLHDEGLLDQMDAVTFVPMSAKNMRARGFNQSELLARKLAKLVKKPVVQTLRKIRVTQPQMQLTGEERRQNLLGAFTAVSPKSFKRVLLVDDVYTTGATARECSRTLIASGFEQVMVLTLARTPVASSGSSKSKQEILNTNED